ncbi:MAG: hypothetical protein Fur0022_01060 [Anaerolineales bacterium]
MNTNPVSATNFYVSLKSKPLILLVGPDKNRSKETFVEQVAASWVETPTQFQRMAGHAWWAAGSAAVCQWSTLQAQFNAEKFFAVVEEACQPENQGRAFFLCLEDLSPAELLAYFSSRSFQAVPGERLLDPGLADPIPYPPNLFVIGTMNAARFPGYDGDLLQHTTVIHAPELELMPSNGASHPVRWLEDPKTLLHGRVRDEDTACTRLRYLPGWQTRAMRPALEIAGVMLKQGCSLPTRQMAADVLIYLSNAWSAQSKGLFACTFPFNLEMALDYAILQYIFPHAWEEISRSPRLRQQLLQALDGHFPRCQAWLHQWDGLGQ